MVGRVAIRADLLLVGVLRQARAILDTLGFRAGVRSQVAQRFALELVQQKGLFHLLRVRSFARVFILLLPYTLGPFGDNCDRHWMFFGA